MFHAGTSCRIFFFKWSVTFCPYLFKVLSTYSLNDHSSVTFSSCRPRGVRGERCYSKTHIQRTCRPEENKTGTTKRGGRTTAGKRTWRDCFLDLCSDIFLVIKKCLVSAREKEDNVKIMIRVKGQCTVYMQTRKVIKSHSVYLSIKSFDRILLLCRIFLYSIISFHFPDYLHVLSLYPSALHNSK